MKGGHGASEKIVYRTRKQTAHDKLRWLRKVAEVVALLVVLALMMYSAGE